MKKREFLKLSTLAGAGTLLLPGKSFSSPPASSKNIFILPGLEYGYEGLLPHIDKKTMQIHHSRHFQSYTDKLNTAVTDTPYAGMDIEMILKNINISDTALRDNGGGYFNHKLFFESLSPQPSKKPVDSLADAIHSKFGSLEEFQDLFSNMAINLFGSGWVWLTIDNSQRLSIVSTPNQDNPLMAFSAEKGYPLMGIDVWEHAYYLHYQNRRDEYIKAFWKVLDWQFVEQRYRDFLN